MYCVQSPQSTKGSVMCRRGPTSTQRKGLYGPLASLRTLLVSTASDVALPKIVTLRRGDAAAARVVIGPLTKTRHRTKTGS